VSGSIVFAPIPHRARPRNGFIPVLGIFPLGERDESLLQQLGRAFSPITGAAPSFCNQNSILRKQVQGHCWLRSRKFGLQHLQSEFSWGRRRSCP
jgi:hypothetical protein